MRFFIRNYINKLSKEDIYKFGIENDIVLSFDETDIVYGIIKDKWEEIIYGDFSTVLGSIQERFDKEKIKKIESLFYLYKEKYKDYL